MTNNYSNKHRRNRFGRMIQALFGIVLLFLIAVGLYYNNLLNRLSFDNGRGNVVETLEGLLHREPGQEWQIPGADDGIRQISSGNQATGEVVKDKNVINILLIGSDYRIPNSSDPGRADVTMLCSLNKKTGSIKLVSFERGIMVDVPGVGTDLLTHSFRWGGAELTTQILRDYFLLNISGYAHVDFESFSALVDAVGGVDITLTDNEAWALELPSGVNHLGGEDALRYCRLRSIDSNWQRIERQRNTVQAILNQMKDMGVSDLDRLSQEVLPLIHTDLSKTVITTILLNAPKFLGATAEQMTVPDNYNQDCDFQYESDRLKDFLYK